MSQAGKNVLLIDADLRRPRLHHLFGQSRDEGMIELLMDESKGLSESTEISEISDALDSWKTVIDNLSLVTAGKPITPDTVEEAESNLPTRNHILSNPAELLSSDRMETFIANMRESFDIIVIDTPPILAAADALLLSSLSDAALLVVRSGFTKEGELDMALDALDDVGANLLGAILNGFDIGKAFGHKYRYQNYTRYGHYSDYAT